MFLVVGGHDKGDEEFRGLDLVLQVEIRLLLVLLRLLPSRAVPPYEVVIPAGQRLCLGHVACGVDGREHLLCRQWFPWVWDEQCDK